MDDFVRKPFRFNEIYECLSKQLGLRFIYEGEGEAELTEDVVVLTPDMLLALAEELRSELGRRRRVWKVGIEGGAIRRVGLYDQKLQRALAKLAENFDYPTIPKALVVNKA